MFVIFQNVEIGALETLMMALPESVGILACGLGLIGGAVLTRWLMARGDEREGDKN